ncbi:coiled-coil domain-containing protein [Nocardiopsis mangrovi]|uniref:Coiled-coil domain-containing protein n=1 Tax=Nocardiopsis mangrovi TaxID=1179818 RepID=A0ABV9DUY8_9ACTN
MEPQRPNGETDFADFWAADPPCPREWPAIGPAARRTGAAAAAIVLAATAALVPSSTAWAAAGPTAPMEPEVSLDTLLEQSEGLSDEYQRELFDMEAVIEDAQNAADRADKTREEVDDAQDQVRRLAIASYTNGGIDPSLTLFVEDDPQDIIDQAQLVEHLSTTNQDKVDQLEDAIARDEKAQDNADEKVEVVKEDLEELDSRRAEVQGRIADFPAQEMGGEYNITPRTEQMRDLVIEEFGENKENGGVGCYRPDGGFVVGEHPKGRACDFMINGNGQMPTAEQRAQGDAIAEWAIENGDRLGIYYIIWSQRIYNIDGGGWREMSDRGSITENHYDHVHISML